MKNLQDRFLSQFNHLDHLCQELFPANQGNGFDSLRNYSDSLPKSEGDSLRILIQLRNAVAHNEADFFRIQKPSLVFLKKQCDAILTSHRDKALEDLLCEVSKANQSIQSLSFFTRLSAKRNIRSVQKKATKELQTMQTLSDIAAVVKNATEAMSHPQKK
jgi:hypothetical protein